MMSGVFLLTRLKSRVCAGAVSFVVDVMISPLLCVVCHAQHRAFGVICAGGICDAGYARGEKHKDANHGRGEGTSVATPFYPHLTPFLLHFDRFILFFFCMLL